MATSPVEYSRCPGLSWSTASDGTVVTWTLNSPEFDLVGIRNRIRNYMTVIAEALVSVDPDSPESLLREGWICPACGDLFSAGLAFSTLKRHLSFENDRLSNLLLQMLDVRQKQPGELSLFP